MYAILYGLPNKIKCTFNCIHLFMLLFLIPSQSVFGKSFAKPLAKAFRKTSIVFRAVTSTCLSFILSIIQEQIFCQVQYYLIQDLTYKTAKRFLKTTSLTKASSERLLDVISIWLEVTRMPSKDSITELYGIQIDIEAMITYLVWSSNVA